MKKKHNIRQALWYFVLALPLLAYLFQCFECAGSPPTLADVIAEFNASTQVGNTIYDTIKQLFSNTYLLGGLSDAVMQYFTYFVSIELIHVLLDFVLILPQLCHDAFAAIFHRHDDD